MNKIISMNEEVHLDFSVEELEKRLETDPLFMVNLLGETPVDEDCFTCTCLFSNYE
jgi:hypothetical protein